MRKLKLVAITALVVLAVPLLFACKPKVTGAPLSGEAPTQQSTPASSTPSAAGHQLIVITEKGFSPQSVTVKVGTNVIWSNSGKKSHSVVLDAKAKSGPIKPNGTAAHVFKTAGTYNYSDGLDPANTGVVIVK